MTAPENEAARFLKQLYTATKGDLTAQQSMHDVGAAIGLDREQAGKVAENLIGEGLVEVKTLSGGVGITAEGIKTAQASGAPPQGAADMSLGDGPVIQDEGRAAVDILLTTIKSGIAQGQTPYARLEEVVVDIKTIEVQMLSPRPKTTVIKAVLASLQQALAAAGLTNLAIQVENSIKS